jgi:hypothetical protein
MKVLKKTLYVVGMLIFILVGSLVVSHPNIPLEYFLLFILLAMWGRYETRLEQLSMNLSVLEQAFQNRFPDF